MLAATAAGATPQGSTWIVELMRRGVALKGFWKHVYSGGTIGVRRLCARPAQQQCSHDDSGPAGRGGGRGGPRRVRV